MRAGASRWTRISHQTAPHLCGGRCDRLPQPGFRFDGAGPHCGGHAFGKPASHSNPATYPYGIYTIPEISFIGKTEEQLTDEDVPYEVGVAYYREIARGQIRGDTTGRLKLIFHRETREILGVHIIGEGASELLHIGQAVMVLKGKIDYFVDTVFNYPTLAECYKAAAFQRPEQAVALLTKEENGTRYRHCHHRSGSQLAVVSENAILGRLRSNPDDSTISDSLRGVPAERIVATHRQKCEQLNVAGRAGARGRRNARHFAWRGCGRFAQPGSVQGHEYAELVAGCVRIDSSGECRFPSLTMAT